MLAKTRSSSDRDERPDPQFPSARRKEIKGGSGTPTGLRGTDDDRNHADRCDRWPDRNTAKLDDQ